MNNRLTQLIAEMDKDDAKKIEALTGVIAIGGYLREVAADEDQRDPKIDEAGRTIVTDALRYLLERAPTAEEAEQVLSGGFGGTLYRLDRSVRTVSAARKTEEKVIRTMPIMYSATGQGRPPDQPSSAVAMSGASPPASGAASCDPSDAPL